MSKTRQLLSGERESKAGWKKRSGRCLKVISALLRAKSEEGDPGCAHSKDCKAGGRGGVGAVGREKAGFDTRC